MNNLVCCRNIDNINDVIFGFFGYGKRQFNLNAVCNVFIAILSYCRCFFMVKLVNIRTVNKGNLGADGRS